MFMMGIGNSMFIADELWSEDYKNVKLIISIDKYSKQKKYVMFMNNFIIGTIFYCNTDKTIIDKQLEIMYNKLKESMDYCI
jgi:hypothetical protein